MGEDVWEVLFWRRFMVVGIILGIGVLWFYVIWSFVREV